jgi:uncharacterized DUF497 family protein
VYINRVIIRDKYADKIWRKHQVDEDEVLDVLLHRKTLFRKLEKGRVAGEDLFGAYGQTKAGRYLSIFFIHKFNRDAFVISARDMDRKERKRYAKT